MIKWTIWTIWTLLSSVLKKADKLNISLSLSLSPESSFTASAQAIASILYTEFETYTSKISATSHRGHWIKASAVKPCVTNIFCAKKWVLLSSINIIHTILSFYQNPHNLIVLDVTPPWIISSCVNINIQWYLLHTIWMVVPVVIWYRTWQ